MNIRGRTSLSSIAALVISAGFSLFFRPNANAQVATECYRFKSDERPAATDQLNEQTEIWCYRNLIKPAGAKLIYNIDDNGFTRPELSIMLESDGSITHGSLLTGELSVYRNKSNYNPFNVPLTPPVGGDRVSPAISPSATESHEKTIDYLTTTQPLSAEINGLTEGITTVSVEPDNLPWRGYWFPYKSGRLHTDKDSPLAKLDRMVRARSGVTPGAQVWEAKNHAFKGVAWSGHCNGWAAASVLRKEPKTPVKDWLSGVEFTVFDQKGILIVKDYCPKNAFFGKRNNGSGSGSGDIEPVLFHNTMTYYLGQLKKPVLMDIMSTKPVENRAISGYTMKITQVAANVFSIEMDTTIHTYDTSPSNEPGVAPTTHFIYKYKLWIDDQGAIVKGKWLSRNPDFLWVPLSTAECKGKNPHVTEPRVQMINKALALPGW